MTVEVSRPLISEILVKVNIKGITKEDGSVLKQYDSPGYEWFLNQVLTQKYNGDYQQVDVPFKKNDKLTDHSRTYKIRTRT